MILTTTTLEQAFLLEQKGCHHYEDGTNKSSKLNLGTLDVRVFAPKTQNKIIVTVLSLSFDGLQR